MPRPEHPFDLVASDVARWIHDEATWYANALTEGYRAPFSANVSETDKLDYYRRQMYQQNSDGSIDYTKPNTAGRTALFKRVTPEQYVQIAKATAPGKGAEHIQSLGLEMPTEDLATLDSQDQNPE